MKRIHFTIRGQVQGVGFRYFCQVEAVRPGLTGYAENKSDGSVEVEAQGPDAALEEFERAMSRGPRRSEVTEVEREEVPLDSNGRGFEVL